MATIIDLTHPIAHGMITVPGLPGPIITDHLSREASRSIYADGTTFQIGRIDMIANTGTYVDAPLHRFVDGPDIASLPLARLADLEGIVVRVNADAARAIDRSRFAAIDGRGKAVIIHTGWSSHFGTPRYRSGHPFLTRDAAEWLVTAGAALVGIDSLNIDDATDSERPAHTLLLAAGIPIVEHLTNVEALPLSGFRFFAVPAPVRGMGSFPARAFAIIAAPDLPGAA